jgi:predicted unusual protein kinase regulating ubiquinone biosynthesis (AarF/ABC1/UbiB family)
MSLNVGAKAAGHAVSGLFGKESEKGERLKSLLIAQLEVMSRELGELKGSVMKVGQMLSVYGEHFLPPEANAALKSLQSQAPPLVWTEIEKVLIQELGHEKLALLDIDSKPLASASLGQVHRARRKSDGAELVLKIQYPGVDRAIEGDIKALRYVLSATKLIPKGPKYDAIFDEIKAMLYQEMDYEAELRATQDFKTLLKPFPQYIVPEAVAEFSTRKVIATFYEPGVSVDGPEVRELSQERRNRLGIAALELYFLELFRFGKMQTDPHFGNYRIRLGSKDRLILFDFGAVKQFDPAFLKSYFWMVKGSFYRNPEWIARSARELDFFREVDSAELREQFCELCYLFAEPFQGMYDWGANDLPKRAAQEGSKVSFAFKLRPPPRDAVFLDRKMGGVFIFLSVLRVKADTRDLLENHLKSLD